MAKKIFVELDALALAHWLQDMCDEIENGEFVCSVEHIQHLQSRLELILDISDAIGVDNWNGPETWHTMLKNKGLL